MGDVRRPVTAFEFATAGRIVFGRGRFDEAGTLVRGLGTRALVVTGRSPARGDRLVALLAAQRITASRFIVTREPAIETVRDGVRAIRQSGADLVIAVGGGSAIDAGKAMAAVAANDGDITDYLEIVGRGQPLIHASLPFVAIPTTAGTGSEVTRNAVLTSPADRVKASLRSPLMLPRLALVDPDLTVTTPRDVTAATGLDALTQLIEAYVSRRATAVTDLLAADGMRRAAGALRRAVANGDDHEARDAMSLASLYSGLALSSAGLGAVHALAGPLGGMLGAPHGALCAALLPHVFAANLQALETRPPARPVMSRFEEVARLLTGNPAAAGADGMAWLRDLVVDLGIPRLHAFGLTTDRVADVVAHAGRANSMKTNPVDLTPEELTSVLAAAM
jgi:alcohol dehydrogenase class IV